MLLNYRNDSISYQIYDHSVGNILRHENFKGFVVNSQWFRTGETIFWVAVDVVDNDTEVVFWIYLFDKDIGAVSLKWVVCSIKSDVMWISKATAYTWIRYNMYMLMYY